MLFNRTQALLLLAAWLSLTTATTARGHALPNRIAKRQETLPPPSVTISELLSTPLAETLPQQPSTIVSPPVVLPSTVEPPISVTVTDLSSAIGAPTVPGVVTVTTTGPNPMVTTPDTEAAAIPSTAVPGVLPASSIVPADPATPVPPVAPVDTRTNPSVTVSQAFRPANSSGPGLRVTSGSITTPSAGSNDSSAMRVELGMGRYRVVGIIVVLVIVMASML